MAEEEKDDGFRLFGGEDGDMGFMGHIEELRKRILWSLAAIVLSCIITGLNYEYITYELMLGPALKAKLTLQNLKPFGQPFLVFKVIFISGFILSFPFILYQIWKFISPGLYDNEKTWASKITFFTTLCFLAGISFAYFVMIPQMLDFASSFGAEYIPNNIDINEYFGFVTMMMLASGVVFEMPMVSFVLGKVGILNSKLMRKYWRHAVVVILVLSAVLTPTPDPINQMFFALPLLVLYEISIWIVKFSGKKTSEV